MRLPLPATLALICSTAAGAESIDWVRAESGIPTGYSVAFSGCAPAASIGDYRARKTALLRAHHNLARSKHVAVSGEEHISTDQKGASRYDVAISEAADAYLHPVTVVGEDVVTLDNVAHVCVLIIERQ